MNLPYTTTFKGTGGTIKKIPEHFIVDEIPLYEPTGTGNHLYINITKTSLNSSDVQKKIAKTLQIKEFDVGFAGMKDKNAVTTQTFSAPLNNKPIKELIKKLKTIENDNLKINWTKLHKNKIKPGHLLGNKFKIIISDIDDIETALKNAKKIIRHIKKTGVPNYFGEQRFGIDKKNIKKGYDIITGKLKIKDKSLKRFLINSYQSYLCNLYLAGRVNKGLSNKILKGDIAKKYDTGGLFLVEDVKKEQKRYDNKEITFTAPMYGVKMWDTESESKEFEDKILENSDITLHDLKKLKIQGTRRTGRLLIKDIKIKKHKQGLQLEFTLPKGSFATVVLREVMKN